MKNNKSLCIMSSGNSDKFGIITEYFKDSEDFEITCLSDNESSDVFCSEPPKNVYIELLNVENIRNYFETHKFDLVIINEFLPKIDSEIYCLGNFIKIHPSLLPAFPEDTAIQDAFTSGVKVSGITVHSLGKDDNNKILAQYPILISNLMHFDDYKMAVYNLENSIVPIVIEKLLEKKLFDFQDLFNNSSKHCGGNCGGCGHCH